MSSDGPAAAGAPTELGEWQAVLDALPQLMDGLDNASKLALGLPLSTSTGAAPSSMAGLPPLPPDSAATSDLMQWLLAAAATQAVAKGAIDGTSPPGAEKKGSKVVGGGDLEPPVLPPPKKMSAYFTPKPEYPCALNLLNALVYLKDWVDISVYFWPTWITPLEVLSNRRIDARLAFLHQCQVPSVGHMCVDDATGKQVSYADGNKSQQRWNFLVMPYRWTPEVWYVAKYMRIIPRPALDYPFDLKSSYLKDYEAKLKGLGATDPQFYLNGTQKSYEDFYVTSDPMDSNLIRLAAAKMPALLSRRYPYSVPNAFRDPQGNFKLVLTCQEIPGAEPTEKVATNAQGAHEYLDKEWKKKFPGSTATYLDYARVACVVAEHFRSRYGAVSDLPLEPAVWHLKAVMGFGDAPKSDAQGLYRTMKPNPDGDWLDLESDANVSSEWKLCHDFGPVATAKADFTDQLVAFRGCYPTTPGFDDAAPWSEQPGQQPPFGRAGWNLATAKVVANTKSELTVAKFLKAAEKKALEVDTSLAPGITSENQIAAFLGGVEPLIVPPASGFEFAYPAPGGQVVHCGAEQFVACDAAQYVYGKDQDWTKHYSAAYETCASYKAVKVPVQDLSDYMAASYAMPVALSMAAQTDYLRRSDVFAASAFDAEWLRMAVRDRAYELVYAVPGYPKGTKPSADEVAGINFKVKLPHGPELTVKGASGSTILQQDSAKAGVPVSAHWQYLWLKDGASVALAGTGQQGAEPWRVTPVFSADNDGLQVTIVKAYYHVWVEVGPGGKLVPFGDKMRWVRAVWRTTWWMKAAEVTAWWKEGVSMPAGHLLAGLRVTLDPLEAQYQVTQASGGAAEAFRAVLTNPIIGAMSKPNVKLWAGYEPELILRDTTKKEKANYATDLKNPDIPKTNKIESMAVLLEDTLLAPSQIGRWVNDGISET